MALLLDTHALLWWCADSCELSPLARKAISREKCFLSLVSVWEITIKVSLGKLKISGSVERFIVEQLFANDFTELPIDFRSLCRVEDLPWLHRDPFDRLLIAQAMEHKLQIVTRDPMFVSYGIERIW